MSLWIFLAALLAAVLAAVLWPLLRPRPETASRADYDIEIYLDQLRELERDVSREVIDASQAGAAKLEIERRLLAASRSTVDAAPPSGAARRGALAVVLALAIAGASIGLYTDLGSPGLPNLPFAQRAPAEVDNPRVAQARANLPAVEARLSTDPENPDVWRDLGSLRLAIGDNAGAVEAFTQAMAFSKGRPDIASVYGEALTIAADGLVTPAAQQAFLKALSGNPSEPRARFYMAEATYQAGRREEALDQWAAIAAEAPPGAQWLPAIADRIRRTASELGVDVTTYLPAAPGPTNADIAAAGDLSPEEQEAFIRSMVERLAARLETEPEDVEGWRRLGQSYVVLNDPLGAAEAYAKAVALEPNHPETLFRAGVAAAQVNDRVAALGYFESLRRLIPEDSDAYRTVNDAIERLKSSPTVK